MPGRRRVLIGLAAVFLLPAFGCAKKQTAEQQVRAVIEAAEQAAEKRELGTLRDFVSDRYLDADGNDKKKVEGILRFYFLRQKSVHLYTHVESVDVTKTDAATAVVYVAMAGTPVQNADELQRLQADFFRFEMSFVDEDGDWRVLKASWRRAEPTDFIR